MADLFIAWHENRNLMSLLLLFDLLTDMIARSYSMLQKIRRACFIPKFLILCFMLMVLDCNAKTQNINSQPTIEVHDLQNQLGSYRHIQFAPNHIELDVVILNEGYHARLYQQKATNQSVALSIREVAQKNNSSVAINGGFYTSRFQPAGLLIENGKTLKKNSHDPLLVSCIQLDKSGALFLEKKINNCLYAPFAMQTGPLLIERGNISPNFTELQKKLINLKTYFEPHRRSILAQSSNKKMLVIMASPITLFEAANILKNLPRVLGVDSITMALNLDGGASTGMYIKSKKTHFYMAEKRPVKTLLLFE